MSTSAIPVAPGSLPLLGHAVPLLRGSRLDYLLSVRAYGDAVTIYLGPKPVHVLTSPDLIHRALVVDAKKFAKGLLFERARPYVGYGLLTSDGQFHKRQRQMIQPGFHHDSINGLTSRMTEAAGRYIGNWRAGQTVAVEREMHGLMTSIISHTLFNTEAALEFGTLVQDSLPELVNSLGKRTLVPATWLYKIPTRGNRRFHALASRLHQATQQMIAAYQADGEARGDLMSILLAARDATGTPMSKEELGDEILTLFIAGIETCATTLTWAFHELGRRPDLRNRLHNEVDTVLAGRSVESSTVSHLPFTNALIHEVLRVHSPTWLLMRRTTEPVQLGAFEIPAGRDVLFSPAAPHHHPESYSDPFRFDPDRWLGPERRVPPRFFIPFGSGGRKCIGEAFAWNQLHVAIAAIAARWQLDPLPKHQIKTGAGAVLHIRHLPMTLRPRRGCQGK
ncbi:cytochrome P450 [Saccharopolyspora terrae]|uniref:Cytochrome P450 n=1 Tax=Saccharopolyspora terrae TaxID=2530384 RepID=A0A4R4V5L2_9PSEU|nr:cytochrome P450 [Saccharopolyspora terrae]TDC99950.1 cytochrome P450 [Saccharopolyspora terrae]